MVVPVALRDAFAFFENPENLARITPPGLNLRITSKERVQIKRGAEIAYQIRWAGIPLSWKTVITEYEPPFRFVDEQAAGPYAEWRHTHTFKPGVEGTEVLDHVDYVLPFGWIGRTVHRLIVRRQLERIFAFRQQSLARIWSEVTARAAQ